MGRERLEGSRRFSYTAPAITAATFALAFLADRYGINFAAQHALTPETGIFAAKNTNNLWDSVMITLFTAYPIYEVVRNKAHRISRWGTLGLSAAVMAPGIFCNVASEVPALNNTTLIQKDLPPAFHSNSWEINRSHLANGLFATGAVEGAFYVAIRRRRRALTASNIDSVLGTEEGPTTEITVYRSDADKTE